MKKNLFSGLVLLISSILAIINSSLFNYYYNLIKLFNFEVFGHINLSIINFINEGLMSVYFFIIGLEIKHEFIFGKLKKYQYYHIIIYAIIAFFGVLIPSFIYLIFNIFHSEYINGWAIPTATDITLTLTIINVLKSYISHDIKILVSIIAIFDDIYAIIILAIFYNNNFHLYIILILFLLIILLTILHFLKIKNVFYHIMIGIIMWLFLLNNNCHPILTGFILSIFMPYEKLIQCKTILNDLILFFILPIFIFFNSGMDVYNIYFTDLLNTVFVGIFLGLFCGKPLGIFFILFIIDKLNIHFYKLSKIEMYGIGLLCGIGFSMSLFIGEISFINNYHLINIVKFSILCSSTFSTIVAYIVFKKISLQKK